MTGFGIRSCRDHWHVTRNGEDYPTTPNELTRADALAFADRENLREGAWQTADAFARLTQFFVGPRP